MWSASKVACLLKAKHQLILAQGYSTENTFEHGTIAIMIREIEKIIQVIDKDNMLKPTWWSKP